MDFSQNVIYVAIDGSWGPATGMLFLNIARWTDDELVAFSELSHEERFELAAKLAAKYAVKAVK